MYMQNIIKMCAAPVYWLFVAGASAAAIDFATAVDNHCRNRSARCRQIVDKNQRNKFYIAALVAAGD
jgi:hypothetical protein